MSVAAALKFVKLTTVPVWVKVPATLSVRPAAAAQLCWPLFSKVNPELRVRSCVAVLRSMPEVPMVRVLPELMVTAAPGPTILIPAQLRSAPSDAVVLPAVTVLVHCAMSVGPGRVSQLEARLRASVLSCLERVAAWAAAGTRTKVAREMARRMRVFGRLDFMVGLGF